MTLSVDEFTNNLTFGGAKANLYKVFLDVPPVLSDADGFSDHLTLMARSAQLPDSTLGVIELPYQGRTVKEIGNRTYSEWMATFYLDEDLKGRKLIEQWHQRINDAKNNTQSASLSLLKGNQKIVQMAKDGSDILEITLHNCWPQSLPIAELAWDMNDQVQELITVWQYDYYTYEFKK